MSFPVTLSKAGTAERLGRPGRPPTAPRPAPADYAAGNGTLTFAPGETSKSISVSVVGDLAIEPDETFDGHAVAPGERDDRDGSATGTIRNEDTQVPVIAARTRASCPRATSSTSRSPRPGRSATSG